MKRSSISRSTLIAGLFGVAFAFLFLMLNDPDAPSLEARAALEASIRTSRWFVLLPAAFLIAAWRSADAWASGSAMTGGVFVGTCVAAVMHSSSVWPIAGVYWTIIWILPIVAGSAAGALVSWWARRTISR